MALRGNLRDFTISQLLNVINLAGKTGTLIIERGTDEARITFREGKLAYAMLGNEDSGLGAILQRGNKISHSQFRLIQQRAAKMSDKELGLLLINSGYLSQQEIINALQQYFASIIRRMFTWVEGLFNFDANMPVPDGKIAVRMDLENLIMEGTRQLREWQLLQDEIPSLDMTLKFTERPGVNIRNMSLGVEEWKVVRYIDPKNTIAQIARATGMNDVEIRRVVYGLIQSGVVEIFRAPGSGRGLPAPILPGASKEEQKTLVNRLIERIKTI